MPRPQFHVYIAASADGFIAREDGSTSWLAPFDAEDYGYEDFTADIDGIVMGRKTYDQVSGFGEWPYQGLETYVLTSRPLDDAPEGVRAISDGIDAFTAELAQEEEPRTFWLMGGAEALHSFLKSGQVDRLDLFIMPLLLGSGVPLFKQGGKETPLTLKRSKSFPNGVIALQYQL